MAAISWKTGQNGDWGTAADWTGNPARVPGASDAVTIAAAGNYTITISSAEAANSLVLNAAGAELLDTASLTIGTSFTETAGYVVLESGSITGGRMSIAAGASLASAGASSMSAALSSAGEIDVSTGTLALGAGGSIAGTLDGAGTLALSGGTFTAAGGAALSGTGYEQLTNSARLNATVTSTSATSTVGSTVSFGIDAGGTLAITKGAVFLDTGTLTLGSTAGAAAITGPGTLSTASATTIADAGTNVSAANLSGQLIWQNSGVVDVFGYASIGASSTDTVSIVNQAGAGFYFTSDDGALIAGAGGHEVFTNAGTLSKTGGSGASSISMVVNNTGVLGASAGATLALTGGGVIGGTVSGLGTVSLQTQNYTLGAIGGAGTLWINGVSGANSATETATAAISAGIIVSNSSTLAIASGKTLTLGGPLTFGETSNVNGYQWGALSGPGTLITTGVTNILDGGSGSNYQAFIGGNVTWTNSATGIVTVSGLVDFALNGGTTDGAAINNQGNFDFAGDDAQLLQNQAAADSFSNTGTLAKISGTGTSSLSGSLTSSGLISAASGTLALTGGGSIAGTITGAGVVQLYDANFSLGAIAGAGTLDIAGGSTRISATETLTATVAPAVIVQDYATLAIAAGKNLTLGGALTLGETINVNGYQWSEISGPGTLTTTAATTIVDGGNSSVGYEAFIDGNITWINAASGTVTVAGQADFGLNGGATDGAAIINQGNFDFVGLDAQLVMFQGGETDSFTNTGTLAKLSGANTTTLAAAVNSTGLINAAAGTLSLSGGGAIGGTITGAGVVQLFDSNFTLGAIAGAGTLDIAGGSTRISATETLTATIAPAVTVQDYATLAIAAGKSLTLGNALTLGEAINVNGYQWAEISGPGTLTTTAATTIVDGGNSGVGYEAFIDGNITWINAASGTVTVAGQADFGLNGGATDGAAIINQGNFDFVGVDSQLVFFQAGETASFTNTGTLAKLSGANTTMFAATLASTGMINVAAGTLAANAGGSLGGTLAGAGTLALAGSFSTAGLSGSGHLAITGANTTLTQTGTGSIAAALLASGNATLAVSAAASVLTLPGRVTLGDATGYGAFSGPGTIATTGTTAIFDGGGSGLALGLGGGVTWANAGTVYDAGLVASGTGSATITNSGIFDLTTDDGGLTVYTDAASFTNTGTLAKTGGTGTSTIGGVIFASTGVVTAGAGTLALASGGTLSGSIGSTGNGVLLLAGGSPFQATGALAIADHAALASVTVGNGVALVNSGIISDAGLLTLGTTTSDSTSFTNSAAGTLLLQGADAGIAAKGAATIINAGLIERTGSGLAAIGGSLTNGGTIESIAGTLKLAAVAGSGTLKIDAGATLEISSAAAQTIAFTGGAGATLKLDHPVSRSLLGFGAGDRLDLAGTTVTSAAVSGTTLTVKAGATTYSYTSAALAGALASFTTDGAGGSFVSLTRLAGASHTPEPLAFGNHHVGDSSGNTLALTVGNTAIADGYSEFLNAGLSGATAGFSAAGTVTGIAAGSGNASALTAVLNTSTAGSLSGTAILTLASDGTGLDGHGPTALPSQTVNLTGSVYAYAAGQASNGGTINLGVIHAGVLSTGTLGLTNGAAAGAYSEALDGSLSGASAGLSAGGSVSGLLAGSTDTANLVVGVDTAATGNYTGSALLGLASDGTAIGDGLGTTTLTGQTITVLATVDNYALAAFEDPSGPALTGTSTNATLNLGSVALGGAALTATLGVLNDAPGLSDLLAGTITGMGGAGFTNSGFGTFGGLGAGQDEHAQLVSLSTGTAGVFTETVVLSSYGTNASGYSGALATETLTVVGTVTSTYTTYTLDGGPNVITGADGRGDIFIASAGSLNSRDQLTGGNGANSLSLVGGGTFDINALKVFSNIPTVKASEGQAASGTIASTLQTVLLSDIASETLTVAAGTAGAGNANAESIRIYGASSTNSITLASGRDQVVLANGHDSITLGGTANSVSAGSGTALIRATAAFAQAAVVGNGAAATTLEITTGGAASLNAADTYVTVQMDAAGTLRLSAMGFISAIGSTGNDSITALGGTQTLTGGLGTDALTGYTGGNDMFADSAAGLNGDTIRNWTTGDVIDLKDISAANLHALGFTANTLRVTDGATSCAIKFVAGQALNNFSVLGADAHGGTLIGYHP